MTAAGSSKAAAAAQQQHLDSEDSRVKRLTESVLYDLIPAALHTMLPQRGADPAQDLDAERCRVRAVEGRTHACMNGGMHAWRGWSMEQVSA